MFVIKKGFKKFCLQKKLSFLQNSEPNSTNSLLYRSESLGVQDEVIKEQKKKETEETILELLDNPHRQLSQKLYIKCNKC
jgi:hypothetical protein